MFFLPRKNLYLPERKWGSPKFQRGIICAAAVYSSGADFTLHADAGLSSGRECIDSGTIPTSATLTWYQVGDASGRGGEVWCDKLDAGTEDKMGDWLLDNDASGSFYIEFSNLVGDTPDTGATFNVWHKIGGTSSANRFQQISAPFDESESATFDVDLGIDASTSLDGPSDWNIQSNN